MADAAAVLWTGGKDSALAYYEAGLAGLDVACLVTFAPPDAGFLAHPLPFIRVQAQAMQVHHYTVTVDEPYRECYVAALKRLRQEHGVGTVVTGDIAEVEGHPNWMRECAEPAGVEVSTPLWGADRRGLLERFLSLGFKAVFSCVSRQWLPGEWVGSPLDGEAVSKLAALHEANGCDVCGENGEYHTLVVDGPPFKKEVKVDSYSRLERDSLTCMSEVEAGLGPRRLR